MKSHRFFLNAFFAHKFFKDFLLIYPVYLLLFESKGLSVVDISLLLVIWSISLIVLEIPSGILADRWSRKSMIIIGTSLKVVALLLWLLAEGFALFAASFVFWGVQEAFCSGSTEALLFDVLKHHSLDHDYEKYAGRGAFYTGIAVTLSMLCGGFVASIGFPVALWASVVSVTLSVFAAVLFAEPKKTHSEANTWKHLRQTLVQGLNQCKNNRSIRILLLFSSLIVIAPGILGRI